MLSSPEKLDPQRRYTLESRSNEIFLSAMSIAELMIKQAVGKIQIHFDPLEMASETDVEILSFSGPDAVLLGRLPMHHKDPFDRMIIAQAMTNGMSLMSDDPKFSEYECVLA
jgi:PIN domain nuclease of toxin-antitoxin system